MKLIVITFCAATMLLLSCNNGGTKTDTPASTDSPKATADAKPKTMPDPIPLDSATKANNWIKFSTPSDVHKMMASWDGIWNTEITTYIPGQPPMKSTGTSVNKMILGGRYQESVNTSNMMGMPFEGHGLLAYNNATKLFESTWIDNMGTAITNFKGSWDPATKSMTMTGKMMNAETLTEMDYKQVFKTIDDKTQTMEMYGPGPDGKEMKVMELKYTRK